MSMMGGLSVTVALDLPCGALVRGLVIGLAGGLLQPIRAARIPLAEALLDA